MHPGRIPSALLAILTVSCAAHVSHRPHRNFGAEIEALARRGCYRCLQEALRLSIEDGRNDERSSRLSLLVQLRAKELGLPETAGNVAPTPPTSSAELQTLASAVAVLPSRALKSGDVEPVDYRAANELRPMLLALSTGDLSTIYIVRSFRCAFEYGDVLEPIRAVNASDPPLLRYRSATCGSLDGSELGGLLRQDPDFVEILGLQGDIALGDRRLRAADDQYDAALQANANWEAVRLAQAGVASARRQLRRSIAIYRRVLANVPDVPAALLGLSVALSYDGQFGLARDTLDKMLAVSSWNRGDAWYWRAWNSLKLNELDVAAHDVAEAKRLDSSARVLKLSGTIALYQERFDTARTDLEGALAVNDQDCEVVFLLGAVEQGQRHPDPARQRYRDSRACFSEMITGFDTRLERLATATDEERIAERQQLESDRADACRWRDRAEALLQE